jgi:hypothetical protein
MNYGTPQIVDSMHDGPNSFSLLQCTAPNQSSSKTYFPNKLSSAIPKKRFKGCRQLYGSVSRITPRESAIKPIHCHGKAVIRLPAIDRPQRGGADIRRPLAIASALMTPAIRAMPWPVSIRECRSLR